ncbi:MAG: ATPase [Erythrobacter sp.]|nr:ATPase [Erythrobacter sp.]
MSGGKHIRAVGQEDAKHASPGVESGTGANREPEDLPVQEQWEEPEESESTARFGWVAPVLATLAAVAWTGFFGWTYREDILAGGTPRQWIDWAIDWSIPVLLIVSLWLLAMRNSRRESARFANSAGMLARESANLETRLTIVNRELSLAREFLASQARGLESLGRVAAERLAANASQLQDLIQNNGAQLDAIAGVSTTALTNMEKLRDDLPVIANSARDVSNQIGNAGRTAHEQLDRLIAGFDRLNHFGLASERQVGSLTGTLESTIGTFEEQIARFGELAEARFEALRHESETFRTTLDVREVEALAAVRSRADELRNGIQALRETLAKQEDECVAAFGSRLDTLKGESETLAATLRQNEEEAFAGMRQAKERLYEEIAEVVARLDAIDQQVVASARTRLAALIEEAGRLDEQMARIDDSATRRSAEQATRTSELAQQGEAIAARIEELNSLFETISAGAEGSRQQLDQGIAVFSQNIAANMAKLHETETALASLTDSSVRLLEILQSGARQSREDLPRAIEDAVESLAAVEQRAIALGERMDETGKRGEALSNYVIATSGGLESAGSAIDTIFARFTDNSDASRQTLGDLRDLLAQLEQRSAVLSERTREQLTSAISQLDEATRNAFANLETANEAQLAKAAQHVGERAAEAIDRALVAGSAEAIATLEHAAENASTVGREAALQLRDQLAKVNELAVNIEKRVERARELAREQTDNDFARRMALITESLNSNAIDLTRILSSEVSDTAWNAYLKGDRGIFTRRAVRLLDASEMREISAQYQQDEQFRDHVNHYVHDFEFMLRSLLSTRDGNVLGVTVLSSDVGKLYVALAQAIDRLRS